MLWRIDQYWRAYIYIAVTVRSHGKVHDFSSPLSNAFKFTNDRLDWVSSRPFRPVLWTPLDPLCLCLVLYFMLCLLAWSLRSWAFSAGSLATGTYLLRTRFLSFSSHFSPSKAICLKRYSLLRSACDLG